MPHVAVFVRRDSGSGLSTSTIIIIAVVAGSVVILVFALFAWRLLARWCRSSRRNVPLPPVQDLAHHREQQLAAFSDRKADRPTTWVESTHYLHPPVYSSRHLAASGSNTSLMRSTPDFASSRGPTRESSWAIEDATSAESSPYENLQPPNPSFIPVGGNPHNSMTSVASSSSDVVSDFNAGLPASPSEMTHSIESSASLPRDGSPAPARPRPPRTPARSRSRPMSIVSSAGTTHSMQTSHSATYGRRGAPHSIHSNIQIVLPTPLAPELYPLTDVGGDRQSAYAGGGDRRSVADQWVLAGTRPAGAAGHQRGASSSSRASQYAAPRPSQSRPRSSLHKVASASSLRDADSASVRARRAQSQPPAPAPLPTTRSAPAVHAHPRARTPSPGPSPGPGSSARRPISGLPPAAQAQSAYQYVAAAPGPSPGYASASAPTSPAETVFQPRSPMPPVPRIPSMYGQVQVQVQAQAFVPGAQDSYFPPMAPPAPPPDAQQQQQQRGRTRVAAPLAGAMPAPGYPTPPPSAAGPPGPRRAPSAGKLRKSGSGRVRGPS